MQSNLNQFKRKMSNLMRPGKPPSIESPTHSGHDEEKSSAVAAYEAALIMKLRDQAKGLPINNPHKEQEILDGIDAIYFSASGFDASAYELKKLPETPDVNKIITERDRKKNQLHVVSKKVSDLILHHHPHYSSELQKVTELQASLSSAHEACRDARRNVQIARSNFSVAGLTILGTYRKRQLLVGVLEVMKRLKALKETDQRLRELFEEENYVGAILMCSECQRAAATFRQYRCISDLAEKLQDTMGIIEEQLDNALAATAMRVDLERYGRVVAAYEMLGKVKEAADIVVEQFSKAIASTTESIINSYRSKRGTEENVEIFSTVPSDQLVRCLRELLTILWRIWLGYHTILLWHIERPALATDDSTSGNEVVTKLELGLSRLWHDSVVRVNALISASDLCSLKFDQFLTVVDLIDKMTNIGRRHFKSDSGELEATLRGKGVEYFQHYHKNCWDELATFLHTEAWEPVPVKRHFTFRDLPEYAFFSVNKTSSVAENVSVNNSLELMTEGTSANPFEASLQLNSTLNTSSDGEAMQAYDSDDSDVPDELKRDFIDESAADISSHRNAALFKRHDSYKPVSSMQPIVCNSALTLLRIWGRYLQCVNSLPSIAYDVMTHLAELYDFYFLTINSYFASDSVDFGVNFTTPKLYHALRRIESIMASAGRNGVPNNVILNAPNSSPLSFSDRLFGLADRVVAVESFIFVSEQLDKLRPTLERSIPQNKMAFISQFFTQTVGTASELRRSVYGAVASKALNYAHFREAVARVNWEIPDLQSQHSEYVDFLTQDLNNFRLRLSEVARNVQIPKEVHEILWEYCCQIIAKLLVDGYACAKKCTTEGRALMQLDFQQLLLIMEKMSNLRPLPHREYVEGFIKAYYLPETAIEQWIKDRKDYSPKHLINLLNVATHISKKTRQRLTAVLENNEET